MKRSITLHAIDKKMGMTVGELRKVMDSAPDSAHIKVNVNFSGGIKVVELIEEVEERG